MVGYVALGSNLGDREENLRRALLYLEARGVRVLRRSRVYETEPENRSGDPWFLNAVAEVDWGGGPGALLDLLLAVERDFGRRRRRRDEPRVLDLDLLWFGGRRMETPRLTLPHPRMWRRRFVLAPLAELAPRLRDPATGRTVSEILAALPASPAARPMSPAPAPVLAPPRRRPV